MLEPSELFEASESQAIYEAYEKNGQKFITIRKLAEEINTTLQQRHSTTEEIKKISTIVFRNFSDRKDTLIDILKDNNNSYDSSYRLFLNTDGFSLKQGSYSKNTTLMERYDDEQFLQIIREIAKHKKEIRDMIKRDVKKSVFDKFIMEVDLIKPLVNMYKKVDIKIYMPMEYEAVQKVENEKGEEKQELTIKHLHMANPNDLRYKGDKKLSTSGWGGSGRDGFSQLCGTTNQNLQDKMIIEQIYPTLKKMLEEYLASEQKSLSELQTYYKNLKEVYFSAELMLIEIEKTSKEMK